MWRFLHVEACRPDRWEYRRGEGVCISVCVCVKWFSSICAVVPKLKKHLAQNLDC